MVEGLTVWSLFALFGMVIVVIGPRLSKYADVIAEKGNLGRSWIGFILLALVTSLPEVASSSTAALIDLPDVVFGNVYGSNLFNVLIIAIIDFMTKKPAILERASRNNLLPSSFGIKMMSLSLLPLVLYNLPFLHLEPIKILGIIDITSLLIIFTYIVGMRMIYQQEKESQIDIPDAETLYGHISFKTAMTRFIFLSCIIVSSAICLSFLADKISTYEIPIDGGVVIGQSLVGIILLAIVTSLPELMVSIGAVKIGAVDMALGNVLGSNMFNMLIIGIADFFYHSGSLLNRPTVMESTRFTGLASHLLIGLAGIIMLCVVSSKLASRTKTERRINLSSYLLVAIFVVAYILLFFINFS